MGFFKRLWTEMWESGEIEDAQFEPEPPIDNAPQELKDAEKRCPDVKFVQSCRAFYEKRGFLSDKQRNCLRYSGTPNRRHRQFYGHEPSHEDGRDMDEAMGFDPW